MCLQSSVYTADFLLNTRIMVMSARHILILGIMVMFVAPVLFLGGNIQQINSGLIITGLLARLANFEVKSVKPQIRLITGSRLLPNHTAALQSISVAFLPVSRWQKGLQAASQVDVRPMTKTSDGVVYTSVSRNSCQ